MLGIRASMGRPTKPIELTEEERAKLQPWARRPKTAQRLALRARIVLGCADGLENRQVARQLQVTDQTVCKWRERFRTARLAGMVDEPRPGTPRKITDAQVEALITRTWETTPEQSTPWSTRTMAQSAGMSQSAVSRIWRAFALQPHGTETFKLSADPFFIEKVGDIVGLYLHPPARALVLCVDAKSPIQALDRTRPILPMRPGGPARQSHDYIRNGTTSVFAALDVASGQVIARFPRRQRQPEFLRFLERVDEAIPEYCDMHLVMDNYGTHKLPKVQRWLARRPRYHLHFTPTSASWLNQVARFFGLLTERRMRRGTCGGVRELESAIRDYLAHHNQDPQPFKWTADADSILKKISRFCMRTSDSAH
jgi:transposase